jgi:hypothetical protein
MDKTSNDASRCFMPFIGRYELRKAAEGSKVQDLTGSATRRLAQLVWKGTTPSRKLSVDVNDSLLSLAFVSEKSIDVIGSWRWALGKEAPIGLLARLVDALH